jgi:hypothetical protein
VKNLFGEKAISYGSYLTIKERGVIRSGYLIIKGNIKNNGSIKVIQCLLNIIIYDQNNNVISTDKLYVAGDIAPGKARTIHSMTAWPTSAKTYSLAIKEVRLKQ